MATSFSKVQHIQLSSGSVAKTKSRLGPSLWQNGTHNCVQNVSLALSWQSWAENNKLHKAHGGPLFCLGSCVPAYLGSWGMMTPLEQWKITLGILSYYILLCWLVFFDITIMGYSNREHLLFSVVFIQKSLRSLPVPVTVPSPNGLAVFLQSAGPRACETASPKIRWLRHVPWISMG